jgi:selenocysteine lyase/cysteine desulfurase
LPLLDGRLVRYINLDNAASTPPLQDVLDAIQQFLPHYASVHRGAGHILDPLKHVSGSEAFSVLVC